jgi:hypothetical protein
MSIGACFSWFGGSVGIPCGFFGSLFEALGDPMAPRAEKYEKDENNIRKKGTPEGPQMLF